ncbi:signal recognition particle, SRP14 subunit [Xylaria flabelliformis]|nr:signal recognition particle, SRP14 subunit [Xylaria flabelliformis]
MSPLSNDEFFAKLVELFDSRKGKDHGSIVLTQKRCTPPIRLFMLARDQRVNEAGDCTVSYNQSIPEPTDETVIPDLHPPQPLPILIRVTNAKGKEDRKAKQKIKLSTVVEPDALPAFFERYADVCKLGMASLKPRDRSKRKGKAKKKSKAGAATTA